MKRIILCIIMFLIVLTLICFHMYKADLINKTVSDISQRVYENYYNENWQEVEKDVESLVNIWKENRLWTSSVMSTDKVDEIEISIEQSYMYSKIRSKENFIGEFRMFCMLIEHIKKQEEFSIYELL